MIKFTAENVKFCEVSFMPAVAPCYPNTHKFFGAEHDTGRQNSKHGKSLKHNL
jgi:hypothetical protein